MADLNPQSSLTEKQWLRLEVLSLVQNDTAAAQDAINEIGDDQLKFELFKRQYTLAQSEPTAVSRTTKAIRGMKEALELFQ